MQLKVSNSDHLLLVDKMGNPAFRYVGDHPGDVEALMRYIKGLKDRIIDLENFIRNGDETTI